MQQQTETTSQYFKATLCVKGTAPRCRKVDFHCEDLQNVELNASPEDLEEVKKNAKVLLGKYKNVVQAYISLKFTTYDGTFESIELMGTKNKNINLM